VNSDAVRTESLNPIVDVDPAKVIDSAPESRGPEIFNRAPQDPVTELAAVPPRFVSVTVAGAVPVVIATDVAV